MNAQLSPFEAYNRRYSRPANTIDVWIDNLGLLTVRYDYDPGDPGCLVGPPDNWIEPSPDEIELISIRVHGREVSIIDDKVIEEAMAAISDHHGRHWIPKYRRRAPGPGGLYAGNFF